MNYTQNYKLNQWERSDKVLMEDFNADNAKIDTALAELERGKAEAGVVASLQTAVVGKGNCQVVTGQYTGDGKYGRSVPNTLTFDKKPMFVLVHRDNFLMLLARGRSIANTLGDTHQNTCVWGDTSVSWYIDYIDSAAWMQLNESGAVYTYIAFLEA